MIIGIGNKARQGKDTIAKMIQELKPNCKILHFADGLWQEVSEMGPPLIIQQTNSHGTYYLLRNTKSSYDVFTSTEVPKVHNIFISRGITEYQLMIEKDAEILQFWGTDYRRKIYGEDYWIKKLAKNLKIGEHYLIPDTRFLNEYEYIKKMQGVYVSVKRFDGENILIDPSRDPRHSSETELDNIVPDIEVKVTNGDFSKLKLAAKQISQILK